MHYEETLNSPMEEGLAMFLALSSLTEQNWVKEQFNEQPRTIVDLLEQAVK